MSQENNTEEKQSPKTNTTTLEKKEIHIYSESEIKDYLDNSETLIPILNILNENPEFDLNSAINQMVDNQNVDGEYSGKNDSDLIPAITNFLRDIKTEDIKNPLIRQMFMNDNGNPSDLIDVLKDENGLSGFFNDREIKKTLDGMFNKEVDSNFSKISELPKLIDTYIKIDSTFNERFASDDNFDRAADMLQERLENSNRFFFVEKYSSIKDSLNATTQDLSVEPVLFPTTYTAYNDILDNADNPALDGIHNLANQVVKSYDDNKGIEGLDVFYDSLMRAFELAAINNNNRTVENLKKIDEIIDKNLGVDSKLKNIFQKHIVSINRDVPFRVESAEDIDYLIDVCGDEKFEEITLDVKSLDAVKGLPRYKSIHQSFLKPLNDIKSRLMSIASDDTSEESLRDSDSTLVATTVGSAVEEINKLKIDQDHKNKLISEIKEESEYFEALISSFSDKFTTEYNEYVEFRFDSSKGFKNEGLAEFFSDLFKKQYPDKARTSGESLDSFEYPLDALLNEHELKFNHPLEDSVDHAVEHNLFTRLGGLERPPMFSDFSKNQNQKNKLQKYREIDVIKDRLYEAGTFGTALGVLVAEGLLFSGVTSLSELKGVDKQVYDYLESLNITTVLPAKEDGLITFSEGELGGERQKYLDLKFDSATFKSPPVVNHAHQHIFTEKDSDGNIFPIAVTYGKSIDYVDDLKGRHRQMPEGFDKDKVGDAVNRNYYKYLSQSMPQDSKEKEFLELMYIEDENQKNRNVLTSIKGAADLSERIESIEKITSSLIEDGNMQISNSIVDSLKDDVKKMVKDGLIEFTITDLLDPNDDKYKAERIAFKNNDGSEILDPQARKKHFIEKYITNPQSFAFGGVKNNGKWAGNDILNKLNKREVKIKGVPQSSFLYGVIVNDIIKTSLTAFPNIATRLDEAEIYDKAKITAKTTFEGSHDKNITKILRLWSKTPELSQYYLGNKEQLDAVDIEGAFEAENIPNKKELGVLKNLALEVIKKDSFAFGKPPTTFRTFDIDKLSVSSTLNIKNNITFNGFTAQQLIKAMVAGIPDLAFEGDKKMLIALKEAFEHGKGSLFAEDNIKELSEIGSNDRQEDLIFRRLKYFKRMHENITETLPKYEKDSSIKHAVTSNYNSAIERQDVEDKSSKTLKDLKAAFEEDKKHIKGNKSHNDVINLVDPHSDNFNSEIEKGMRRSMNLATGSTSETIMQKGVGGLKNVLAAISSSGVAVSNDDFSSTLMEVAGGAFKERFSKEKLSKFGFLRALSKDLDEVHKSKRAEQQQSFKGSIKLASSKVKQNFDFRVHDAGLSSINNDTPKISSIESSFQQGSIAMATSLPDTSFDSKVYEDVMKGKTQLSGIKDNFKGSWFRRAARSAAGKTPFSPNELDLLMRDDIADEQKAVNNLKKNLILSTLKKAKKLGENRDKDETVRALSACMDVFGHNESKNIYNEFTNSIKGSDSPDGLRGLFDEEIVRVEKDGKIPGFESEEEKSPEIADDPIQNPSLLDIDPEVQKMNRMLTFHKMDAEVVKGAIKELIFTKEDYLKFINARADDKEFENAFNAGIFDEKDRNEFDSVKVENRRLAAEDLSELIQEAIDNDDVVEYMDEGMFTQEQLDIHIKEQMDNSDDSDNDKGVTLSDEKGLPKENDEKEDLLGGLRKSIFKDLISQIEDGSYKSHLISPMKKAHSPMISFNAYLDELINDGDISTQGKTKDELTQLVLEQLVIISKEGEGVPRDESNPLMEERKVIAICGYLKVDPNSVGLSTTKPIQTDNPPPRGQENDVGGGMKM